MALDHQYKVAAPRLEVWDCRQLISRAESIDAIESVLEEFRLIASDRGYR